MALGAQRNEICTTLNPGTAHPLALSAALAAKPTVAVSEGRAYDAPVWTLEANIS